MDDLNDFVLDRLADDERRFEAGELPYIDEAERRGRLRIMRTDDHRGLLLVGGPVQATEDRVPVPFVEKAAFLRREFTTSTTTPCWGWSPRCTTRIPIGGRSGGRDS